MDACLECLFRRDQTQNQVAILGKIVEVARVNENTVVCEERESEEFVGLRGGDAEDGVPSGFERKARAKGLRSELHIELRQVGANARQ